MERRSGAPLNTYGIFLIFLLLLLLCNIHTQTGYYTKVIGHLFANFLSYNFIKYLNWSAFDRVITKLKMMNCFETQCTNDAQQISVKIAIYHFVPNVLGYVSAKYCLNRFWESCHKNKMGELFIETQCRCVFASNWCRCKANGTGVSALTTDAIIRN